MLVVSDSKINWLASDGKMARSAGLRMMNRNTSDLRKPSGGSRLDLPLVDGLDAAADDRDRIGAAIEAERDDRGRRGAQPDAGEGQREEEEINLHQKRRVAGRFDEADRQPPQWPEVRS